MGEAQREGKETQITETDDDGKSVASGRGCPEKGLCYVLCSHCRV